MQFVSLRALPAVLASLLCATYGAACTSSSSSLPDPTPPPSNEALLARAKPFELDTRYEPPPGDPLEHNTSGYAKTMCSAVFITGLDPDCRGRERRLLHRALRRAKKGRQASRRSREEGGPHHAAKRGPRVAARHFGSQGCVTLPRGRDDVFFTPVDRQAASAGCGDRTVADGRRAARRRRCPAGIDGSKVKRAIDAAFEPAEALTSAFVVTYKGPHHRRALQRRHRGTRRRSRAGRWGRA